MPKIQIDIPDDAYQRLKIQAQDDDRSLTKYLARGMVYLANIPEGYHNQKSIDPNAINLSALPEGTTIKTTTTRTLTPEEEREQRFNSFQKLAKQIVGHTLDVEDYRIMDYNSDHNYYDRDYAVPLNEGSSIYCVYIYDLPLQRQRQYLEEYAHYDK